MIDEFIVQTPTTGTGNTLLPPSKKGVYEYYALMYTVRKEVSLNNEWNLARSWGRSGDGTKGWSGQQPTDANGNTVNYQTGYCRVVGEGMPNDLNFNFNNIRDISYRNDRITLETYCYDVYNKADYNRNMGRFPESPENIVFRYSIWGIKNPTSVNDYDNQKLNNSIYDIRCETSKLLGQEVAIINFKMSNPKQFKIFIYDLLGNQVIIIDRGVWNSSEEQKITINMDNQKSGTYLVIIRSDDDFGTGKFFLVK